MGKVRAALIHFSISIVVFCTIIAVAILAWYPPPYFFADGGWQMIQLAAGVDVVLGPLLTLVVFKAGKPRLKLDLSIIGIVQISVLIWGTTLMYQQRPLFVAFGISQFFTVTEEQLAHNEQLASKLKSPKLGTPEIVFVKIPDNPKEAKSLLMAGAHGEAAFYTHPRLYAPLSENISTVLRTSLDITTIANRHPEDRAKLDVFLQKHGGQVRDYAFLPLRCRYESLTMVLHKPDGKVVGTIDISPPLT